MNTRADRITGILLAATMAGLLVGQAIGWDLGMTGVVKGVGKRLLKKGELILAPIRPSGPAGGSTGTSYGYYTGGAMSSLGHPLEYRFDWGDGARTEWSRTMTATHSWSKAGMYSVIAEARCWSDMGMTAVSPALVVTMVLSGVDNPAITEILIPAGDFQMGSTIYGDEKPIHTVHLDAYYIDKYEVTLAQYDTFCGATGGTKPSDNGWGRDTRPALVMAWDDARAYCAWAGKRLPTEAEWERACRAGTDTVYSFGNDPSLLDKYAWYGSNSDGKTHPVGEKAPNAFGLYDMYGNVWEWCADWYDAGYYAVSPLNNPQGPASGSFRVVRGGAWHYSVGPSALRSAYRGNIEPKIVPPDNKPVDWPYATIGCRCARTP